MNDGMQQYSTQVNRKAPAQVDRKEKQAMRLMTGVCLDRSLIYQRLFGRQPNNTEK